MPKKKAAKKITKAVEFKDKKKVTAYYEPKRLTDVQDELRAENKALCLDKSHSDLLVTLSWLWSTTSAVKELVRAAWKHSKTLEDQANLKKGDKTKA